MNLLKKLYEKFNYTRKDITGQSSSIIEKSGKKCLIISNKNLKLLGTLTDGDIRNLIISGKKLNTSIENFYNKNPKFVIKNQYNIRELRKEFLKDRYELIPVVDKTKNSRYYFLGSSI